MRTKDRDLQQRAVDDLAAAFDGLGIRFDLDGDGIRVLVGRERIPLDVRHRAVVNGVAARTMIDSAPGPRRRVLVADRISASGRSVLDAANWSWFDRRGEISLRIRDTFLIRTAVGALPRHYDSTAGPIRSRAGLVLLAAALEQPDVPVVLRAVARRGEVSHVALSAARTKLADAGLIEGDGRPIAGVTFEALSDSWSARVVPIASLPNPTAQRILGVNGTDASRPGWALTDTMAAVAWGARLPVVAKFPPDFYVPTARDLERTVHHLGAATDFSVRAATVTVAPVPFATARRFERGDASWLTTHPLYIALSIAQDHSRGPEILAAWAPSGIDGFRPLW